MQSPSEAPVARSRHNIGDLERWVSIAAGTALALYGLGRRRPGGLAVAAVGGLLVRRGAIGHCTVYQAFGLSTASTSDDTRSALGGRGGSHVEETDTVTLPASEVYPLPSSSRSVNASRGAGPPTSLLK